MSFSIHTPLAILYVNLISLIAIQAKQRLRMIYVSGNLDVPVSIESGCLGIFTGYKAREGNKRG